jgi:hypothetical protein
MLLDSLIDTYVKGVQDGRTQVQDDIDATETVNSELREKLNEFTHSDINLYDEVVDMITGFSGTVTAISMYIEDESLAYVESKDGQRWIVINRLKRV